MDLIEIEIDDDIRNELQLAYNLDNLQRDLLKKSDNCKFNRNIRLKEIEDIISRYASSPFKNKTTWQKMMDEINESKRLCLNNYLFKFRKIKLNNNYIYLFEGNDFMKPYFLYKFNNKYTLKANKPNVQFMIENLVNRYLKDGYINHKELMKIILPYYNARNNSGSNWSPLESYTDLVKYKEDGYYLIECFSSPFNQQNVLLNYPVDKPLVDAVFTFNKYDQVLPNIVGIFPDDLKRTILNATSKKILLLLNPIYTEHYIVESFKILNELSIDPEFKEYEIKAMMTLPIWDDLYESPEFVALTKNLDIHWKKIEESIIRNMNINKKINLKIYILTVDVLN